MSTRTLTSVHTARQQVPLADRALELGGGTIDQHAGLATLGLGPPTVAELGANHQEAFGRGLRGHQPMGEARFTSRWLPTHI